MNNHKFADYEQFKQTQEANKKFNALSYHQKNFVREQLDHYTRLYMDYPRQKVYIPIPVDNTKFAMDAEIPPSISSAKATFTLQSNGEYVLTNIKL